MTRIRSISVATLSLVGSVCIAQGGWIHMKAALAQVLLEQAWARTVAGEAAVKPWPWADTWPVGRLGAPALGEDVIVLSGASGRTLAFGPAHIGSTASPGRDGNVGLAGHRDTHFAFLRNLEPGHELWLDSPEGRRHYRVETARVVHERDTDVLLPKGGAELTLVTCFPFDAVVPGGPLRYVVRARGI